MTDNHYEYLKQDLELVDVPDMLPGKEIPISSHPAEIITIFTAAAYGRWAWGYRVCWANGRTSYRNPTLRSGVFQSEHDAILYGIGFMKSYAEYFKPESVENIRTAERRYSATTLPLFDEP